MYQLDKGKHKRSKNGDVYFAVQKVKLSKGIVSKLTQNQLKQLSEQLDLKKIMPKEP